MSDKYSNTKLDTKSHRACLWRVAMQEDTYTIMEKKTRDE